MIVDIKNRKVSLQISGEFTAEELSGLVNEIAQARSQISDDPMTLENAHVPVHAVRNMPYWTEYKPDLNASMFAYRHPGLGWLGVVLPPEEVARLIGYWSLQLVAASKAAAASEAPRSPSQENEGGRGGGLLH